MAISKAVGGSTLRLQRRFAALRERVFEAWTTPEALKRWWCPPGFVPDRMEVDLRVGGTYHLSMRRPGDEAIIAVSGQFLEVRRPEHLVYTWRGAFAEAAETLVTVEFRATNNVTEVVVVHERFADVAMWQRHRRGWIAACDRMERILSS